MTTGTRIVADLYRDSVSLMKISAAVSALPGVVQASCIMATPANLDLLREAGLLTTEIAAGPNEVLVAVEAESADALAGALDAAEAELHKEPESLARAREAAIEPPHSQEMALDTLVGANLALIATPGPFAAAEASKALREVAPQLFEKTDATMPMHRMGDPEDDIAPVVLFLATEDSRYVTGNTLFADGGSHINGSAWAPAAPE